MSKSSMSLLVKHGILPQQTLMELEAHRAIPEGTSRQHGSGPDVPAGALVDQIAETLEDPAAMGPETLLDMPAPTATAEIGGVEVPLAAAGKTLYLRAPLDHILPYFENEVSDLDVVEVLYRDETWTMVTPKGATS